MHYYYYTKKIKKKNECCVSYMEVLMVWSRWNYRNYKLTIPRFYSELLTLSDSELSVSMTTLIA